MLQLFTAEPQFITSINATEGPKSSKIFLGLQAPWNVSYPFSAQRLGSAVQLAIEKINREWDNHFMNNRTLEFVYADCGCNAKTSLNTFIRQVEEYKISALFGPVCPEATEVCFFFMFFF